MRARVKRFGHPVSAPDSAGATRPRAGSRFYGERGDGDSGMLMKVMILCCIVSGGLGIMSWIKAVKDARYAAQQVELTTSAGRGYGYAITYYPGLCGSDECTKSIGN